MTGLAWVIGLLLRLCPEVPSPQSERIFTNQRKWNERTVTRITNTHSPAFTPYAYFEVRKENKANFYLIMSTT